MAFQKTCESCGGTFDAYRRVDKYCRHCRDEARRQRQRVREPALFELEREFRELHISRAPDGYKVIIVNDLHRPFHDPRTLSAVERFWDEFAPDLEVYNGDTADLYTISTFDKNPSRRFHLQHELDDTGRWYEARANANPDARRVKILGNHEDRLRRWLWRFGPEFAGLRGLKLEQLLRLDEFGFETLEYGSVLDLLGYRIEHGQKAGTSKAYPINVSRWMAIATGSSGLCGHTHRCSSYSWTDARGSHTYIENGCLCLLGLEYAPFPNWQQAFTYGVVHKNKLHLVPVQVYPTGFRAEGEFYAR